MEILLANKEVLKNISEEVDIIIGIPSYNNADTIGRVAEIAAQGINKYLGLPSLIINADGGSNDGTRDAFNNSDTQKIKKISYKYKGISGKGSAMLSIIEIAKIIGAKIVIFVDSDLRSIEPWWFERLSTPILNDKTDYITPFYIRHKYDGTITNQVCYPLTSSLYGQKIRQPIGGDFGIGKNMIDIYYKNIENVADSKIAQFGIDIWMTTLAICESKKPVWQAALGSKIHDVKDPGKHLGPMFDQVVSTIFDLTAKYKSIAQDIHYLKESPIYGKIPTVKVENIHIDLKNLEAKCVQGIKNDKIIRQLIGNEIENIIKYKRVSLEQWIGIIFKAIKEFEKGNKDIIRSLIPLYFGRVADFVQITANMNSEEAEKIIEEQVHMFANQKNKLFDLL